MLRSPTIPIHSLALALLCLKQHAAAFGPLQQSTPSPKKRQELEGSLGCWYHAGAFKSAVKAAAKGSGGTGRGGLGVRFSAQEEKWLREGL